MSTAATRSDIEQVSIAPRGNSDIRINDDIVIPAWVYDHDTFRRWAREGRPEKLRVGYFAGTIWVDLSMEQAYSHNDVKTEIAGVLRALAKKDGLGRYFGDGMLLSLPTVEVTTVPDGMYVSHATFDSGKVREIEEGLRGYVELEGVPDMVLEVVSDSSVTKDNVTLPDAFVRAGVDEFWRVDARGTEVVFEIHRLEDGRYAPVADVEGWRRSVTFARDFRLVQSLDARERPIFTLEHRE